MFDSVSLFSFFSILSERVFAKGWVLNAESSQSLSSSIKSQDSSTDGGPAQNELAHLVSWPFSTVYGLAIQPG